MDQAAPKQYPLKPDDLDRMNKLAEEVQAGIEEMAQIFARTVGITLTADMVRKFSPMPMIVSPVVAANPTYLEIICTSYGPCGCLVYWPDGTRTFEFPCGTPGP